MGIFPKTPENFEMTMLKYPYYPPFLLEQEN